MKERQLLFEKEENGGPKEELNWGEDEMKHKLEEHASYRDSLTSRDNKAAAPSHSIN